MSDSIYRSPAEQAPNAPKYRVFSPFTIEEWQALDEVHGDTRRVTGAIPPRKPWHKTDPEPPWEAIFRRPKSSETNFFERHAHGDNSKSMALRNFAKAIVVGVSYKGKKTIAADAGDTTAVAAVRAAWDAVQESEGGGCHMAAQEELMALAGMGKEVEGKE